MSMIETTLLPYKLSRAFERTKRFIAQQFDATNTSLLSPAADFIMAGGASVVLYVIIRFGIGESLANDPKYTLIMYYTAFFANYPHFSASYKIFYEDVRKQIPHVKQNKKYTAQIIAVGWIIPALLLLFVAWAYKLQSQPMMGSLASFMYFLVGWHYIKQIFGCVIVLCAAKKMYFKKNERRTLLFPLYLIWIVIYANLNGAGMMNEYLGVNYTLMKVPDTLLFVTNTLVAIGMIGVARMLWNKYRLEKKNMPASAWVALISIFIWMVPPFRYPIFFLIVPFFHSMQYLLFATAYEKNKCIERGVPEKVKAPRTIRHQFANVLNMCATGFYILLPVLIIGVVIFGRNPAITNMDMGVLERYFYLWAETNHKNYYLAVGFVAAFTVSLILLHRKMKKDPPTRFTMYLIETFYLGFLLLSLAPAILDSFATRMSPLVFSYDTTIFTGSLFAYLFTVLINIHHYFIDSVIWRKENPLMAKYLHAND